MISYSLVGEYYMNDITDYDDLSSVDNRISCYLKRVNGQITYFDTNAIKNQERYKFLKSGAIICNILTTMAIALAFTVPDQFKLGMGIVALILSTFVLATYQWEEFHNYGAKWEKFRLVAEQLKSEKSLFLTSSGKYAVEKKEEQLNLLVTTIENIIRGTDISYFSLMVEPGKRIEKRLENILKKD